MFWFWYIKNLLIFFMHGYQWVKIGYCHISRGYYNSVEDILLDWKPFYLNGRYFTSLENTLNQWSMKTFRQGYLITAEDLRFQWRNRYFFGVDVKMKNIPCTYLDWIICLHSRFTMLLLKVRIKTFLDNRLLFSIFLDPLNYTSTNPFYL